MFGMVARANETCKVNFPLVSPGEFCMISEVTSVAESNSLLSGEERKELENLLPKVVNGSFSVKSPKNVQEFRFENTIADVVARELEQYLKKCNQNSKICSPDAVKQLNELLTRNGAKNISAQSFQMAAKQLVVDSLNLNVKNVKSNLEKKYIQARQNLLGGRPKKDLNLKDLSISAIANPNVSERDAVLCIDWLPEVEKVSENITVSKKTEPAGLQDANDEKIKINDPPVLTCNFGQNFADNNYKLDLTAAKQSIDRCLKEAKDTHCSGGEVQLLSAVTSACASTRRAQDQNGIVVDNQNKTLTENREAALESFLSNHVLPADKISRKDRLGYQNSFLHPNSKAVEASGTCGPRPPKKCNQDKWIREWSPEFCSSRGEDSLLDNEGNDLDKLECSDDRIKKYYGQFQFVDADFKIQCKPKVVKAVEDEPKPTSVASVPRTAKKCFGFNLKVSDSETEKTKVGTSNGTTKATSSGASCGPAGCNTGFTAP